MADEEPFESGEARQRWIKEVEEALDRTGDAVRTAWDTTRDSRLSALESAKAAVKELGEVIEKGVEAAKERWAAGEDSEEAPTSPPPAPSHPASPPEPPAPPSVDEPPLP